MRAHPLTLALLAAALLASACGSEDDATSRGSHAADAPAAGSLADALALGTYDHVYPLRESSNVLLLHGRRLSVLEYDGPRLHVRFLAEDDAFAGARIRRVIRTPHGFTLLCTALGAPAFLYSVTQEKRVPLQPEGVMAHPGESTEIQGLVLSGDRRRAILMISGGSSATWPRSGNRPIFFWADLDAPRVRELKPGWDLEYLTPNLDRAVFELPRLWRGAERGLLAVRMADGTHTQDFPRTTDGPWVRYNWSAWGDVRPYYSKRSSRYTGDARLLGLVVRGVSHPIAFPSPTRLGLRRADVRDGWAAALFRRKRVVEASGPDDSWPLYVLPLESFTLPLDAAPPPRPMAEEVQTFGLMPGGKVLVVTRLQNLGGRRRAQGAFLVDAATGKRTDALAGVAFLPPLTAAQAQVESNDDRLGIALTMCPDAGPGFAYGLLRCGHVQMDHASYAYPGDLALGTEPTRPRPGTLAHRQVVRWIVVTSEGRRLLLEDIPKDALEDLDVLVAAPSGLVFGRRSRHEGKAQTSLWYRPFARPLR